MPQTLQIGGVKVSPGQRVTVDLPVARLYTHTEMTMPVQVIRGKKPGPHLFVSAAVHGDEINGVEIIRRFLKLKLLKQLRGALIAVPVVNVFGFISRSRYLPDRRDLNRLFPGSEKGSLAGRLADLFMKEVVANCTHGIDLHTGSNHRFNLPQIRAYLDDPETERLAWAFGAPVVLDANLRDGSLRQAVAEQGIPMLLYEGGEALRFSEVAIRIGLRGVVSVMRAIGMLPASRRRKSDFEPAVARSSTWVRAPEGGILRVNTSLGTRVFKGQIVGVIADLFGENEIKVLSPTRGIIISRLNQPLVNEGDALFHIASFDNPTSADAALKAFKAEFEPDEEGNSEGLTIV
jgi:predicted deacylase